jgi:ABC-type uncharacterized transport system ATPase subunit
MSRFRVSTFVPAAILAARSAKQPANRATLVFVSELDEALEVADRISS